MPRGIELRNAEALADKAVAPEPAAQSEATRAVVERTNLESLIAYQKLVIEKFRRELYGSRSERSAKLLDQMEQELEDMKASVRRDELAADKAAKALAPVHVVSRGHVGPNLLGMVLHDKFALHQPQNLQSERFAREGIDLSLSTLTDHVDSAAALQAPLLAKGKTVTARLLTYIRDDAPLGGTDPSAAYFFSPDRAGEHPERHLAHYDGSL